MSLFQFTAMDKYPIIPFYLYHCGDPASFFPFAGNFRGKIPFSERWQKLTGFIGFVLLTGGLCLVIIRPLDNLQITENRLTSTPTVPIKIADPFGEDDLEVVKDDVAYLQKEAIDALKEGRLLEADIAILEADAIIHKALSQSPNDSAILNQDGCLHRNLATAYQRLSMNNQAEKYLGSAERSFRLIISFDYEDAVAWKNLGGVYILRDDLARAEECVRKAIELDPDYAAARNDLIWILEHQ